MIKRKIKNYFNLQKIFKEYRRSSTLFWESKIDSDIDEDGLISLEISEYNPLEMEVVQCALNTIRKKNNFKASLISFSEKGTCISFEIFKIYFSANLMAFSILMRSPLEKAITKALENPFSCMATLCFLAPSKSLTKIPV